MAIEIGAFEAKTHFSQLLKRVGKGERIIITRHGVPVAELTPPEGIKSRDVKEVIRKLTEIRNRTKKGKESLQELRKEGRRF